MSIIGAVRKLFLPSPGSSAVEADADNGTAHVFQSPAVEAARAGSNPAPGTISRRTLFSFFGVGAVLLAKPDLFVIERPMVVSNLLAPGLRKEFAEAYSKHYRNITVKLTWDAHSQGWEWWTCDDLVPQRWEERA